MKRLHVCLLGVFGLAVHAFAGPLTTAQITRIINEVKLIDPEHGAHPAALNQVVKDDLGVQTGNGSRAELLFADMTLTRLGANTFFSFKPGTRDLQLDQGSMLLHVPKGLGGAKIQTAGVTAAITGTTIMMEHQPGKSVKVVVLEGSLRLSITHALGQSVILNPGQMVILKPDAKTVPEPVNIDLRKLVETSSLVKMTPAGKSGDAATGGIPLPSAALIEQQIAKQDALRKDGTLMDTNLRIFGQGKSVVLGAPEPLLAALSQRSAATPVAAPAVSSSEAASGSNESTQTAANPADQHSDPSSTTTDRSDGKEPTTPPSNGPGTPSGGTTGGTDPTPVPSQNPGTSPGSTDPTPTPGDNPGTPGTTGGTQAGGGTATDPAPASGDGASPSSGDNNAQPSNTVVNTDGTPSATTNGVANSGSVFQEEQQSAGGFLFSTASVFDQLIGFDKGFAHNFHHAAVFKFSALTLPNKLEFHTGTSVKNVALVSSSGISNGASGSIVDLLGLTGLFLGAEHGSINLDNHVSFLESSVTQQKSKLHILELYARDGDIHFGGSINLPDSSVLLAAKNTVELQPSSHVTASDLLVMALGNVAVNGSVQAGESITIASGGSVSFNGPVSAGSSEGNESIGVLAASTIAINSTVQASPSSKRGPKAPGIVLTSAKTDGVAVDISNTGELLAVLDAARPGKDGKVQITSAGGAIQINGHIDASNGTTEIRNYGTNGAVNIADATIHGDVVKIGAMGNNGTLTVGGGSISADTLLKLYAGGTNGAVVFNNDVALNGQSAKIIAGRTVTIRDGKTVTIGGNNPARVFTDIPNYSGSGGNGSTSGRFGGQGATTQSFGAAPRF